MTQTIPAQQDTTTALSRRDIWLTIALAIAKHGLPAPTRVGLNDSPSVDIDVDTPADAAAWSAHLDVTEQLRVIPTHDRQRQIITYSGRRGDGWLWWITTSEPIPTTDTTDLAAQVVEAIVSPCCNGTGFADYAAVPCPNPTCTAAPMGGTS